MFLSDLKNMLFNESDFNNLCNKPKTYFENSFTDGKCININLNVIYM